MKNHRYIKFFLLPILLLFVYACAKQVEITGGQRDTSPPIMVEASPQIGSTNFSAKKIVIKFDEYIRLSNISQKLIVSPPLKEKPKVRLNGKKIYIYLNPEELQKDVTYYFNFNDAILDNNEGNVLNSFVYAFATGNRIDSLSVSGRVLDAFSKTPLQDVFVLLYNNLSDTAVKTQIPKYITKVDKDGLFTIPYVKKDDYKIFALKDNNFNYIYDLPNEGIAFLDTIFSPTVETISDSDTSQYKTFVNLPNNIELLLFHENKQNQFIKSSSREKPNYIELVFNETQYEDFSVKVFEESDPIIFAKENPDTIRIWLRDKDLIKSNSLRVECRYVDRVFADTLIVDTLNLRFNHNQFKPDSIEKITAPRIKEPDKALKLSIQSPIESFSADKLILEKKLDSVFVSQEFSLLKDSLNPLSLIVNSDFSEDSKYRLILKDSLIASVYNLYSSPDTLLVEIPSHAIYGKLVIKIPTEKDYIAQLLRGQEVLYEQFVEASLNSCEFLYLKPGQYKIRIIEDTNANRRWDTGDLSLKKQAESVFYYSGDYEIKANWTHELEWNPLVKQD